MVSRARLGPGLLLMLCSGVGCALVAGCTLPHRPQERALHLVQKGPYQALYGRDGRLERLVYDEDGDGRAEALIFFGPGGKVARSERDTNGDGVVDRWESFISESVWIEADDTDGDGKPDRRMLHGPDGTVGLPLAD